jgi:molybdopterin molybdotransferase
MDKDSMLTTDTLQRITRLAPYAEILAMLDAVAAPVSARDQATVASAGATLAADIFAPADRPPTMVALQDGWAVASELLADAGPYAPVILSPAPVWVEAGEPMPSGTDAVLPADAVIATKAGSEAHAPAVPGEGVILAGIDAAKGVLLRRAGERLRPGDAAILRLLGIESVPVRAPRVRIFSVSVPTRSNEDTISPLVARAIEADGGTAQVAQVSSLDAALIDRASDAVITIGGTGTGKQDQAVKTLARVGKVGLHGFGISPGETAALGSVDGRPVLMLPGRIDAALATYLTVGRALLARLSGHAAENASTSVQLAKKVTSTVGLAEVMLVQRTAEGVEPLGSGFFPLHTVARADGWILVPPESEGYSAGTSVEMRALP